MVYEIYDIEKRFDVINEIIKDIPDDDTRFDMELILSEAILNANEHGHNFNDKKAIRIHVEIKDNYWEFILEDEDPFIKNFEIKDTMSDADILKESGRGLFIISQLADHVELIDNRLLIRKEVAYVTK